MPTQDFKGTLNEITPHVIQDETTPMTARANLNFTGAGVTVTDNGSDTTVVTIPGGGGGGGGGDFLVIQVFS